MRAARAMNRLSSDVICVDELRVWVGSVGVKSIGIDVASDVTALNQVVQVRNGFTCGQVHFVFLQLAIKQMHEAFGNGLRLSQVVIEPRK